MIRQKMHESPRMRKGLGRRHLGRGHRTYVASGLGNDQVRSQASYGRHVEAVQGSFCFRPLADQTVDPLAGRIMRYLRLGYFWQPPNE